MRVVTLDIETTDIPDLVQNVEKIFCIAVKINDEQTKCFTYIYTSYSDGNLKQALNLINSADIVVGHNIYKFDKPIIERLIGRITPPIVDTLIDTKLMISKDEMMLIDNGIKDMPKNLYGSYSLKAFGYRFNLNKIEYMDFSNLNKEMVEYCKRDVDLTYELYKYISSQSDYPKQHVRELEYKVAEIIFKQQEYGCYFDIDLAKELSSKLKMKQFNLEMKLKKEFPPIFKPDGEVITPSKSRNVKLYIEIPLDNLIGIRPYRIPLVINKKGEYKRFPKSIRFKTHPYKLVNSNINGEYQKIKLVKFNPGSRQQILERLEHKYGYKPKLYTPGGNPKLDLDDTGEDE